MRRFQERDPLERRGDRVRKRNFPLQAFSSLREQQLRSRFGSRLGVFWAVGHALLCRLVSLRFNIKRLDGKRDRVSISERSDFLMSSKSDSIHCSSVSCEKPSSAVSSVETGSRVAILGEKNRGTRATL